ncbi:hypothetical protein GSD1FS_0540 [Bifidobacterium sp. GSD1FS]|uniref:Uncharacterized protein n=1 Tax=Bifidobacterium canis TaxID=2610880 RepID=A0A7K1J3I7_9BIFI|nr:hypothetical protein [Bifidobacterium canis]
MRKALNALWIFLATLFCCMIVIGKITHTYRYMWIAVLVAIAFTIPSLFTDNDPQ